MSCFRKNNRNPIELEMDGNLLSQPCEAVESFATRFKNVFNTHNIRKFSTNFQSSDALLPASVSDSDVLRA